MSVDQKYLDEVTSRDPTDSQVEWVCHTRIRDVAPETLIDRWIIDSFRWCVFSDGVIMGRRRHAGLGDVDLWYFPKENDVYTSTRDHKTKKMGDPRKRSF